MEKMSRLLGDGAGNFFESYERERSFGLRVNPLKAAERLPGLLSGLERIPWSREGFYYPEELRPESTRSMRREPIISRGPPPRRAPRPGSEAGAERILDLCAAPGGKEYPSGREDGTERGFWCAMRSIRPGQVPCPRTSSAWGSETQWVTNMEPAGRVPGFREFSRRHRRGRSPAPGKGCSVRMRMQGWNGARPR